MTASCLWIYNHSANAVDRFTLLWQLWSLKNNCNPSWSFACVLCLCTTGTGYFCLYGNPTWQWELYIVYKFLSKTYRFMLTFEFKLMYAGTLTGMHTLVLEHVRDIVCVCWVAFGRTTVSFANWLVPRKLSCIIRNDARGSKRAGWRLLYSTKPEYFLVCVFVRLTVSKSLLYYPMLWTVKLHMQCSVILQKICHGIVYYYYYYLYYYYHYNL